MNENVRVGQTFKEREPPHRLWEIVRIIEPETGFRHAQLRLAVDHRTTMMLSCEELEHDDSFLPAEPENVR